MGNSESTTSTKKFKEDIFYIKCKNRKFEKIEQKIKKKKISLIAVT